MTRPYRAPVLVATALLGAMHGCVARTPGPSTGHDGGVDVAVPATLPLAYAGEPTAPQIRARDLMTRVYRFAADSTEGRETGTAGHVRSTAWLAAELRRLGVEPAGDDGTYFQAVPMVVRPLATTSSITIEGATIAPGSEWVATVAGAPRAVGTVEAVYGGATFDTTNVLAPDAVRGKLLVLVNSGRAAPPGFTTMANARRYLEMTRAAAAVLVVGGEQLPPATVRASLAPHPGAASLRPSATRAPVAPLLTGTTGFARRLFDRPLGELTKGALGRTAAVALQFGETIVPARNVVGIVRGSDPRLRGEFVAVGAHSDHVGRAAVAVDHDSLHLTLGARYAITGRTPRGVTLSAAQQQALREVRVNLDSVRRLRAPRRDSINNGADDDASGSMAALEVAEALAGAPVKPKRSILFVWHTGEEKGLLGSQWFTDHPTVSREAIIAQLNMDMVGKTVFRDLMGHRGGYAQLIGARRLSTELGDIIEAANRASASPMTLDFQFDANGHPDNRYCRSDHFNYARVGIPITYFSAGHHGDYHQVSDEPQYLDYANLARISALVRDVAVRVANLEHRLAVDRPRLDPNAPCRQ